MLAGTSRSAKYYQFLFRIVHSYFIIVLVWSVLIGRGHRCHPTGPVVIDTVDRSGQPANPSFTARQRGCCIGSRFTCSDSDFIAPFSGRYFYRLSVNRDCSRHSTIRFRTTDPRVRREARLRLAVHHLAPRRTFIITGGHSKNDDGRSDSNGSLE